VLLLVKAALLELRRGSVLQGQMLQKPQGPFATRGGSRNPNAPG